LKLFSFYVDKDIGKSDKVGVGLDDLEAIDQLIQSAAEMNVNFRVESHVPEIYDRCLKRIAKPDIAAMNKDL
ncbi:hypothetical protein JZU71_04890, partial [bacterium]|nr:hypothetical protein [bacterium]